MRQDACPQTSENKGQTNLHDVGRGERLRHQRAGEAAAPPRSTGLATGAAAVHAGPGTVSTAAAASAAVSSAAAAVSAPALAASTVVPASKRATALCTAGSQPSSSASSRASTGDAATPAAAHQPAVEAEARLFEPERPRGRGRGQHHRLLPDHRLLAQDVLLVHGLQAQAAVQNGRRRAASLTDHALK